MDDPALSVLLKPTTVALALLERIPNFAEHFKCYITTVTNVQTDLE